MSKSRPVVMGVELQFAHLEVILTEDGWNFLLS